MMTDFPGIAATPASVFGRNPPATEMGFSFNPQQVRLNFVLTASSALNSGSDATSMTVCRS
jgi:hypothetical protein